MDHKKELEHRIEEKVKKRSQERGQNIVFCPVYAGLVLFGGLCSDATLELADARSIWLGPINILAGHGHFGFGKDHLWLWWWKWSGQGFQKAQKTAYEEQVWLPP